MTVRKAIADLTPIGKAEFNIVGNPGEHTDIEAYTPVIS